MRRLVLLLVTLVATGCLEDHPAAPTQGYTSMMGEWVGEYSVSNSSDAPGAGVICGFNWTVTSETDGQFFGTWQLKTTRDERANKRFDCALSGSLSGTITSGGSLTVSFSPSVEEVGVPAGCTQTGPPSTYTGEAIPTQGGVPVPFLSAEAVALYSCPPAASRLSTRGHFNIEKR